MILGSPSAPELLSVAAGGLVLLMLIVFVVTSYNRFVEQRNLIRDSWASVDTELQRRYDLVPNLVETVKGYATHERGLLSALTAARARAVATDRAPEQQAGAESELVDQLRRVFAVAEAHRALRANDNYMALQEELANTEDRLQSARRFYNANVATYNRRRQAIPSNLIARLGRFREAQYFGVDRARTEFVPHAGDARPTAARPRRSQAKSPQ